MTDNPNPLPGPRKSPDSDPPLPAWMTLPGSLVQPASPEDPPAPPSGLGPAATATADPAATNTPGEAEEADEAEADPGPPDAPSPPTPPPPPSVAVASPSGAEPAGSDAVELGATRASEEGGEAKSGPSFATLAASAEHGADERGPEPEGGEDHDGVEAKGEGPGLPAALEAILLVVDEPVAEITLAQVLERPTHEVAAALRGLAAEYSAAGRGFDLREVAGGWRFYTRADCAPLVEKFVRDGQQTRLTQAALETLAVVAYRQPVSRARVAAVRGVNSDGVMRTLVARGLVEEAGTDPESQAVLYRTSSYFLERLGLRDLSELPELAPFLPDDVENLEETTK